jgi:glycosyltransferase involved in cell wall biosynthesis
VRDIADEILVADSGSTDDTLAIVREIGGCRIIYREFVNAGSFKNWAIPQAQHDWVLVLDADERVSAELKAELIELLGSSRPPHDGYWIRRANYFMGHRVRFGPWGADRLLRLFRKDVSCYVGDYDHAEVAINTRKVGRLKGRLDHYTCWSYDEFVRKQERYSSYQALRWHDSGKPVNFVRLYLTAVFRFLHIFVVRGGFLDGAVGLQVATLIAYYSFQKQARLWQLVYCQSPLDDEPEKPHQVAA